MLQSARKRGLLLVLASTATTVVALLAFTGPAAANPWGPQYASEQSGSCLDLRNGFAGEGGLIQIWQCNDLSNQAWVDIDPVSGRVALKNAATSTCIRGRGHFVQVSTSLCEAPYGSIDNTERWIVRTKVRSGFTYYQFRNVYYSNQCLDVRGYQTHNGAVVQLYDCQGETAYNQWWR